MKPCSRPFEPAYRLSRIGLAALLFALGIHSGFSGEAEKESPPKQAKPTESKKSAAGDSAKKKSANDAGTKGSKKGPAGGKDSGESKHAEVKTGPIEVEVELPGILEGARATPIALHLDRWSTLSVVRAVPHGTEVREGDVLIEFDTEDLVEKIGDLREGMPGKKLALEIATEELAKLEKTTPITREKALRAKEQAEEDLAYFEEVSRPMREKDAEQDVKMAKNYLAYAAEELNQLKKMYEADDLTEETEEIILQRAQNSVDEYTWMLEQTEERVRRTLETTIPREHERLLSSFELQRINWRAGEKSMKDELEKKRLDVETKRRELEDAETELAEYESDLEQLEVHAPHAGIVYYGMSQRGSWSTAATVERKLIPGGKLTMHEIAMTVVDPEEVRLRVMTPEDKVGDLEPGQVAEITLKSDPDSKRRGEVVSVSSIPYSDQTFDTTISIRPAGEGDEGRRLVPGLKADAEVVVYRNEDALTLPKAAVKEDDGTSTVTLVGGKKREIEVGRTSGDRIEVLEGLSEGDKVVLPKKSSGSDAKGEGGKSGEDSKKESPKKGDTKQ